MPLNMAKRKKWLENQVYKWAPFVAEEDLSVIFPDPNLGKRPWDRTCYVFKHAVQRFVDL